MMLLLLMLMLLERGRAGRPSPVARSRGRAVAGCCSPSAVLGLVRIHSLQEQEDGLRGARGCRGAGSSGSVVAVRSRVRRGVARHPGDDSHGHPELGLASPVVVTNCFGARAA